MRVAAITIATTQLSLQVLLVVAVTHVNISIGHHVLRWLELILQVVRILDDVHVLVLGLLVRQGLLREVICTMEILSRAAWKLIARALMRQVVSLIDLSKLILH